MPSAPATPPAAERQVLLKLLHTLVSSEGRSNPFPVYEEFRRRGAAVKVPWGAFVVTSHALCQEVLAGQDWLSLDAGWRSRHVREPGRPVFEFLENTVLAVNGPEHRAVRKSFNAFLPVSGVRAARPLVAGLVDRCLDALDVRLRTDGIADFAEIVSSWLPMAVVSALLGLPSADNDFLRQISHDVAYALDFTPSVRNLRRADRAAASWAAYWAHLCAEPTVRLDGAAPLAQWLRSPDAVRLGEKRISAMVGVTVVGGHETTAGLISHGLTALLQRPEQAAWLRAHPERAPDAVEELLRFVSPAQLLTRYARGDTELAGLPVKAGELVHTVLAAANRDPAVVEDGDRLDVTRPPMRHLALGAGMHYCVGAALARLEAEVLIPAVLDRFPRLTTMPTAVGNDNLAYRYLLSMPVRVAAPSGRRSRTVHAGAAAREGSVTTVTDGAVLTVVLDRPGAGNTLDTSALSALLDIFAGLPLRPEVQTVVLAGGGDTFCGGLDIDELRQLADSGQDGLRPVLTLADQLCAAIRAAPQITIARLHGAVVGAGVGLAVCCDLRICAEDATFRLPEATFGLPLAWGGVLARLVAETGAALVREMVLTGDRIDAATARGRGLVHRTVPAARLADVSSSWARRLARKDSAAISTTKRLLDALTPSPAGVDADILAAALLRTRSPQAHGAPVHPPVPG
ncbi:cytochrome P450 [Streptomyces achromogenes]|uniref:cytochrome P450 n=1 Tax=Streptomyces achromogenes TaxID=67255 RepID=UPI0036FCC9DE